MPSDDFAYIFDRLQIALAARPSHSSTDEWNALRLFNGFTEGCPELVIDRYAHTLVLFNYANPPESARPMLKAVQEWLLARLPCAHTVITKERYANDIEARHGQITFGQRPDRKIYEEGIWYALDLQMNQDASLYLDTRELRSWLRQNLSSKTLLNTFAYTGSLGIAALAGGASRVLQLDLNRKFLNLAKDSCALNGLPIHREDYLIGDFYPLTARLRRATTLFDCVILDPPFFSSIFAGRVNLVAESARLLNKVRPLVADGGCLIAINNALFLSGQEYLHTLQTLCTDGFMQVETLIHIPTDCTGTPTTRCLSLPADPAPFQHATKIAILRLHRKS